MDPSTAHIMRMLMCQIQMQNQQQQQQQQITNRMLMCQMQLQMQMMNCLQQRGMPAPQVNQQLPVVRNVPETKTAVSVDASQLFMSRPQLAIMNVTESAVAEIPSEVPPQQKAAVAERSDNQDEEISPDTASSPQIQEVVEPIHEVSNHPNDVNIPTPTVSAPHVESPATAMAERAATAALKRKADSDEMQPVQTRSKQKKIQ